MALALRGRFGRESTGSAGVRLSVGRVSGGLVVCELAGEDGREESVDCMDVQQVGLMVADGDEWMEW
jgi:hypothetical protein